jgi:hypothetical protein
MIVGEGGVHMAKVGRPKTMNPRIKQIAIRLSDDEYKAVAEYAFNHNLTITKTVLEAIQLLLAQK